MTEQDYKKLLEAISILDMIRVEDYPTHALLQGAIEQLEEVKDSVELINDNEQ